MDQTQRATLAAAFFVCVLLLVLQVCELVQNEMALRRLNEIQVCVLGNCTEMGQRFGLKLS